MNFRYDLLKNQIGFADILNGILRNRGISDMNRFLNPTEKEEEDILLYDNADVWTDKYINALRNKKILGIIVD